MNRVLNGNNHIIVDIDNIFHIFMWKKNVVLIILFQLKLYFPCGLTYAKCILEDKINSQSCQWKIKVVFGWGIVEIHGI